MIDTLTPSERSALMGRIRGANTKPEMLVRQLVHGMGYRYRLHRRDLPGTPDLVFPSRRKIIFVHGCFWHRHEGCRFAYEPKSRQEFWARKFEQNLKRDKAALAALRAAGWKVMIIWECETRNVEEISQRVRMFLDSPGQARTP